MLPAKWYHCRMSPTPTPDAFPVAIIGSGIAGLTAAIHLAERGIPPLILEADSQWPGGRMAGGDPDTFDYQGREWSFPTEHGMHTFAGGYDNTRALVERFLDLETHLSPGEDWISLRRGKAIVNEAGRAIRWGWIPAPFHYVQLLFQPRVWASITPLDWLSLPGFLTSILLTVGLDPIMEEIALDGLSMDEYFRLWTPGMRSVYAGLANNFMAAPDEKISLAALIAASRYYAMLRRDVWWLEYLPGNPHTHLVQPLIEAIEKRGGMLVMGGRVVELAQDGDLWRLRVDDARHGGTRSLLAERVILAMDPLNAQMLLENSPATAQTARSMPFPGATRTATVRLWFDHAPDSGASNGMLTGDFTFNNFFWLHRLHDEFKAWHTTTGGGVLEFHLYASDEFYDRNDDQTLIARATHDAQRAFPALRGHLVFGAVRRNDPVQTLFRPPTRDSLHVQAPWPGVYACGDWVGYPTPAMWIERSCVTGLAAANHILAEGGLETFELIPARRPEFLPAALQAVIGGLRWLLGPPIVTMVRFLRKQKV